MCVRAFVRACVCVRVRVCVCVCVCVCDFRYLIALLSYFAILLLVGFVTAILLTPNHLQATNNVLLIL